MAIAYLLYESRLSLLLAASFGNDLLNLDQNEFRRIQRREANQMFTMPCATLESGLFSASHFTK